MGNKHPSFSMKKKIKADKAYDKKHGIKEGSKKDKQIDKKKGIKDYDY